VSTAVELFLHGLWPKFSQPSMWKPFKVDNIGYIIKNVSVGGHHKVLLSNFVNMWGEEITSASLCRRCKVKFTGHCDVTEYSFT